MSSNIEHILITIMEADQQVNGITFFSQETGDDGIVHQEQPNCPQDSMIIQPMPPVQTPTPFQTPTPIQTIPTIIPTSKMSYVGMSNGICSLLPQNASNRRLVVSPQSLRFKGTKYSHRCLVSSADENSWPFVIDITMTDHITFYDDAVTGETILVVYAPHFIGYGLGLTLTPEAKRATLEDFLTFTDSLYKRVRGNTFELAESERLKIAEADARNESATHQQEARQSVARSAQRRVESVSGQGNEEDAEPDVNDENLTLYELMSELHPRGREQPQPRSTVMHIRQGPVQMRRDPAESQRRIVSILQDLLSRSSL